MISLKNLFGVAILASFSIDFVSLAAAAADAKIEWEIENRFRYFKRASDFREIVKVYNKLKETSQRPTALQLEQALEKATIEEGFNKIAHADIRNGWAASVFLHTCGRGSHHNHASCKLENGDDYLNPQKTNLIFRVSGISGGACEWLVDGAVVDTRPCNADATAKNVTFDQPHVLTVRATGQATASANIVLKDALILSFGDSFSAGEGNPEQPVAFVADSYNNYNESSAINGKVQYFPVREDISTLQPRDPKFFGIWRRHGQIHSVIAHFILNIRRLHYTMPSSILM